MLVFVTFISLFISLTLPLSSNISLRLGFSPVVVVTSALLSFAAVATMEFSSTEAFAVDFVDFVAASKAAFDARCG